MSDADIERYQSFRSEAANLELCFISHPQNVGNLFNFYFNQGDIYTLVDPAILYRLVMFGRTHAELHGGSFYDQRDAYGLLTRVVPTQYLNEQKQFAIWDLESYSKDDPKCISLADWLEMNGFPIPELVREPAP